MSISDKSTSGDLGVYVYVSVVELALFNSADVKNLHKELTIVQTVVYLNVIFHAIACTLSSAKVFTKVAHTLS